MKYASLFYPTIAVAVSIDFVKLGQPDLNGKVALDKFRTFASDDPILPHNARPYAATRYAKRNEDDESEDPGNQSLDYDEEKQEQSKSNQKEKVTTVSEACRKDTHIINTSGDIHQLQIECDDIWGDIHFTDYNDDLIDFGKIRSVKGGVYIENSSRLVKIEGNNLERIGATLALRSLTSLVSVNLPSLKEVSTIDWKVLPILNEASLNDQLGGLKSLVISDTSLAAIEGFTKVEDVDIFQINNNRFLETIKTNVKYVRQKLSVHANARETELEMPRLVSAENITVRDTSLVYFPRLETVGSSLEFIQNHFTELRVPNLKTIGGTLGVLDNVKMRVADFANVTEIQGGLMIANNTKLEKIDFFSKLKQIGGAIYFEGRFHDTDFPQLKLVKGSALIKTNSGNLDCSKWTTPKSGRSIVRGGKISCISGRKQKSQSVSEDGTVLDETENNHESSTELDDGSSVDGLFSNRKQSGSAIVVAPSMKCILGSIAIILLGHSALMY